MGGVMKKFLFMLIASLGFSVAFALVDINTATSDELQALPGIGKVKADAIVEYRKVHGPFKSKDDLREVNGIGDKILEKIRNDIEVSNKPAPKVVKKITAETHEASKDVSSTVKSASQKSTKVNKK